MMGKDCMTGNYTEGFMIHSEEAIGVDQKRRLHLLGHLAHERSGILSAPQLRNDSKTVYSGKQFPG